MNTNRAIAFPRVFAVFAHAFAILAASVSFAGEASLESLTEELLSNHPGLQAKKELIRSLDELAPAKMAWDDPVVGAGLMNVPSNTLRFDQEAMTQKTVNITQRVPSLMKRRAEKDFVESEAMSERAETDSLAASLAAMLKKTVYEIAYVNEALEILADNEVILDEFTRIANAKYATGKGIQANVIQAQVERSKLIDRELKLKERKELAIARVNRLLGRDPAAGFDMPKLSFGEPGEADFEKLWPRAEKNSPQIMAAKSHVERAKKSLARAEGDLGMNMAFSAAYGQRDDNPMDRPDFVSVTASISLPLWRADKQDRMIASARARVDEARFRLRDVTEEVKTRLRQAAVSHNKEVETMRLYKNVILPQAEQALASARAAYQLDKLDFLSLLSNEMTLLQYELEVEMAAFRLRSVLADIESLTAAVAAKAGGAHE